MFHHSAELIHMAVGSLAGLFWGVTYVLIILRARRDKAFGMPFLPMCVNLAWEFLFATVYLTPWDSADNAISNITMIVWFGIDVLILVTWLRYWRVDYPANASAAWRYPALVFSLAASIGIIVGLQEPDEFGNPDGGVYSSFAENLLMSALYVQLLVRRGSSKGQSLAIAWFKLLGTVCAALYWIPLGRNDLLWLTLYISIFVLDVAYVILLRKKILEEKEGARPSPALEAA